MVAVLMGEARYAGGRPLPRATVHLYSPDIPLEEIEASGATRIMLPVMDQEMQPQEVVANDPPAAHRSELLIGDSRPTEKHKLLQYVTVTLDDEGNRHLKPPGSKGYLVTINKSRTRACAWEAKTGTVLIIPTPRMMSALGRRPKAWKGWSSAWRLWVGGGSRLQPRPRFHLHLAPELMSDRARIVERLTPDLGGNVSVADVFQGLAAVPWSLSSATGQGLAAVSSSSLGVEGRGEQLPWELPLTGPTPARPGRSDTGAGRNRLRGRRQAGARRGRGQTRSRPSGRGRGADRHARLGDVETDESEDLMQPSAGSADSQ